MPPSKWPGNCHGIAALMLDHKLTRGSLCYGNWWGPIEAGTLFAPRLLAPHHGWIIQEDNVIIDPTRWVFEDAEPYIFQGLDLEDFYDFGGNRLRASFRKPPPAWKEDSKGMWQTDELPSYLVYLLAHFFPWQTSYTLEQLFWMSNLSPDELRPFTREFYLWLREHNMGAYVPRDNMELVMSERWNGTQPG